MIISKPAQQHRQEDALSRAFRRADEAQDRWWRSFFSIPPMRALLGALTLLLCSVYAFLFWAWWRS